MISSDFPFRRSSLLYSASETGAPSRPLRRVVVAASGGGSNFQALLDARATGRLQAEIVGLIASSPKAGAIGRAQKAGIPCEILSLQEKNSSFHLQLRLLKLLDAWKCDVFVLAGFLLKIPEAVISQYSGRILNIHPSLLPKYGGKGFYGLRVHRAVLAAGEERSGCSVHLVNEAFDEGPVLEQAEVEVLPEDTPERLAARVLAEEHRLYPAALNRFIERLNQGNPAR